MSSKPSEGFGCTQGFHTPDQYFQFALCAPHTKAVMHQQFDARATCIGKQVAVMRLGAAEHLNHPGQQALGLLACPPVPPPATARQCESPQPFAQPSGTLGTCACSGEFTTTLFGASRRQFLAREWPQLAAVIAKAKIPCQSCESPCHDCRHRHHAFGHLGSTTGAPRGRSARCAALSRQRMRYSGGRPEAPRLETQRCRPDWRASVSGCAYGPGNRSDV